MIPVVIRNGLAKIRVILRTRRFRIFRIFTHLTEREKLLLYDLSRSLPPDSVIVEIGSYLGASTCFLASAVRRRGGKVYAVDTWTNLGMTEGPRDTFKEFCDNTKPFSGCIHIRKGTSGDIARGFSEKVDLIFIDGDHSYEGVKSDLDAWLPKVKDGGIVVFHDYSWAEGVQRAVKEFIVPMQIEEGSTLDNTYWTRIRGKQERIHNFISIIVPTYGRPSLLNDALRSLLNQDLSPEKYEVIVVDNKPTGEVRSLVEELELQTRRAIRYMEESNPGLHNGRHAGAKAARGEILVFVDDDIVATPGWLNAIDETFQDPSIALVGGRVLPRWEEKVPDWVDLFRSEIDGGWTISYLSLIDFGNITKEIPAHFVYGCNFSIRKSVLYECGGFHPDSVPQDLVRYRGDGEEALSRAIAKKGLKSIYVAGATVYHCVPAKRLTVDYFRQRAFNQGVSDSFTQIRRRHGLDSFDSSPANRMFSPIRDRLKKILKAVTCNLSANRPKSEERQIRKQVQEAYEEGKSFHIRQVAEDAELLEYVLKESYI